MSMTVGERLKQLVREKNMEQKEVALEMGMNSATFNGYVSGKREPSIEKLKQFSRYFGVSVDYLIGHSEIKDPYLRHMSEELSSFVREPGNITYVELAKDIKAKTVITKDKRSIAT